jgi:NCAIR mutase (PurE)-related protein
MKTYLEETFNKAIKDYRSFESEINAKWGGRRRLFKCVDVSLEIKFCKAEMIFKDSLANEHYKKKMDRLAMMERAYTALIKKALENGYKELQLDCRCYEYAKDQVAIVCDYDSQLPGLKKIHGKDKDVVLFSVQELFRFVDPYYMDAKETFKKKDIDITFKKVSYT